eukprot:3020148-Amphidinium_carterae.1
MPRAWTLSGPNCTQVHLHPNKQGFEAESAHHILRDLTQQVQHQGENDSVIAAEHQAERSPTLTSVTLECTNYILEGLRPDMPCFLPPW